MLSVVILTIVAPLTNLWMCLRCSHWLYNAYIGTFSVEIVIIDAFLRQIRWKNCLQDRVDPGNEPDEIQVLKLWKFSNDEILQTS